MKHKRSMTFVAVAGIAGISAIILSALACGGTSPLGVFVVVGQATGAFPRPSPDSQGSGGGGGAPDGSDNPSSFCNLTDEQKSLRIAVRNEATVSVSFALTLVTSAGGTGFVCTDEINTFTDFGYTPQTLVSNDKTFGCDVVTLTAGTELLALTVTGSVPPRLATDTFTSAGAPFDGNTDIPIPELIVLGEASPSSAFSCTGGNLCTQGGFRYSVGTTIPASRTQDTLCNAMVSNRPEWVLRDPLLNDLTARSFEYVKGGTLIITVLDRVTSPFPNQNQVVWRVTNADDIVIHLEVR